MSLPEDAPYDLKNSKLHHALKNRPGKSADETHAQSDDDTGLPGDVKSAIKSGDDTTQLADELKSAIKSADS